MSDLLTTADIGFPDERPTWGDIVREYFPEADDDFATCLLWEYTPFPCGDEADVRRALERIQELEETE